MCEVEFLGGVVCKQRCDGIFYVVPLTHIPYCQIGVLESILYYLARIVKVRLNFSYVSASGARIRQ